MPNFIDRFERPNGAVGNDWKFKNKNEGTAADPWSIAGYRAVEPAGISTLMFRANPVAVGSNHVVRAHMVGKNAAEIIVRYSSTGGAGNYRWSVVVVGTSGKLVRRWFDGTTTVELEQAAAWTRLDDTDFTIRVDITDTTLVVYDTNFEGAEGMAASIESTTYNNATGVGLGSGHCETFEIGDIQSYAPTELSLAPVRATVYTDVHPTFAEGDAGPLEDAVQHFATLQTEPYVIVEGIPKRGDMALIAPSGFDMGTITMSDNGEPIDPGIVNTGADHRWLPMKYLGGSIWGSNDSDVLGRRWVLDHDEPYLKQDYTYQAPYGPITRPAMVFNGGGYMQLDNFPAADGSARPMTIAVVAVLHGGAGKSYSLFQTDRSVYVPAGTDAMKMTYSHGKYQFSAGGPRATYEGKGVAAGASIIILSLNPGGVINRGYLMIQDDRRFSQSFSLRKVDVFSQALWFGAEMSYRDEFTPATAGDLDVLEIDTWDRALSPAEMRRFINKVAPLYGVTT